MEEWISLREFARRREVTLGAVQKAIESGRVTSVRRSQFGRLVAIELHAATLQWNRNTDPDQAARALQQGAQSNAAAAATQRQPTVPAHDGLPPGHVAGGLPIDRVWGESPPNRAGSGLEFERAAGVMPGERAAGVMPLERGGAGAAEKVSAPAPAQDNDEFGYLGHRAKREEFQAKRAELDYHERVGTLVPAADVREQQFTIFREMRDNILAISSRISPRLAAETDPVRIQVMLDEEHRKALNELSRALAVDAAGGAAGRADARP